jgi:hypothetical protein
VVWDGQEHLCPAYAPEWRSRRANAATTKGGVDGAALDHEPIEETKGAAAGLVELVAASKGITLHEAPQLPALERIKRLLDMCLTVDEAAEVHGQFCAAEVYYRKRSDAIEIQNQASEARLRAERRIGELLRATPKHKGGRPSLTGTSEGPVKTLSEIGISKNQASIWQKVAALAAEDFEDRIAAAKENHLELTTYRVLHEAKEVAAAAERLAKRDEAPAATPAPRSVNASDAALREMARAAFEAPRRAFTDELPDEATTKFLRAEAVRFIADLDTFEGSRIKRVALEQPSTP